MKVRFLNNWGFLLLSMFSLVFLTFCTEKKTEEFTELSEDIIFTDSFTPYDWESPISRQVLESGDSDIGNFILSDVTDPGKRKTLQLIDKFMARISRGQLEEIEDLLTGPAYNSFMLRYPEISFQGKYTIRVEDPPAPKPVEEGKQPEVVEPVEENNWVRFKVMFSDKSYLGQVEVIEENENYKIADFENDIFDELTAPAL